MPPPSAIATRFANYWVLDALASDESLDFSVLSALLAASSEHLDDAPEATRERIALRCLQQVLSVIPAAGEDAPAAVLRVDGVRSCEQLLFWLVREVGTSGKLDMDLLPPFGLVIQETIHSSKLTSPESSLQLILAMKEALGMEDVLGAVEVERRRLKRVKVT